MLETKQFYCIETSDIIELNLTLEAFYEGPLPLIWIIKGLYYLIPVQIIQNELESIQSVHHPYVHLRLGQAIKVPAKVAKLLLGGGEELEEDLPYGIPKWLRSASDESEKSSDKSTGSDSPR